MTTAAGLAGGPVTVSPHRFAIVNLEAKKSPGRAPVKKGPNAIHFLADLAQHIPKARQQAVSYHGWFANPATSVASRRLPIDGPLGGESAAPDECSNASLSPRGTSTRSIGHCSNASYKQARVQESSYAGMRCSDSASTGTTASTRKDSPTGHRYQSHRGQTHALLFVRTKRKLENGETAPY